MAAIVRLEARAIAPEVDRFRYTARSDEVYTTTTIVRATDEAGVTGIGASDADSFGDWDVAPLETLRTVLPRLVGIDAEDHERVAAVLTEDGTSAFPPAVRSTIDVALWDLSSRAEERSLCESLGGSPDARSLPSYASVPFLDDEVEYLTFLDELVTSGYGAVKLHAWGDPVRDAGLVEGVRARFPDLTVMHDAEGRYDREGAALVARACADAGVRWFEAPLPDLDLDGYRELRRTVPDVPVLAAGDAIWDRRLMAEVLRDPPWDAVRFDVSFAGGPTAARGLMRLAEEVGLDVELISYGHTVIQAANLHVALAFGRTSYFEQAVPMEPFAYGAVDPIVTSADGTVHLPAGPGLGVDLDDEAIERATIGRLDAQR